MRYIRAVLIIGPFALGLGVSGYASVGKEEPSAEAPTQAVLRDCRSRGEGTAPIKMTAGTRDFRIGPLVLGNVRNTRSVGVTNNPAWPYATKTPVLLPARSKVVLAIAPEAAAVAAFQHRADFVSAVRFTACFERVRAYAYRGTVGPTTFFPFAIAMRGRTSCVPMDLWIDGRSQPVRRNVPIGRRSC